MNKPESKVGVWFTSDTHYFHTNIIKYSNRPFKDAKEMNEELVRRHNEVVKPEDTVYHLGDFGFAHPESLRKVGAALNGNKILIEGNHDRNAYRNYLSVFNKIVPYLEIRISDEDAKQGCQNIVLFHYSMRVWNRSHHGSWQLYGHSHGTLYDDPNLLSMDIGVDCNKEFPYYPFSYEQVKEHMKTKTFKAIDHHGE